jgi:hypothetical protein
MNSSARIKRVYNLIRKSLFEINPPLKYNRIVKAFQTLAEMVGNSDCDNDELWYIGEGFEASLPDMIIGAYWFFTDYHSGQWSDEYSALSLLGNVFSPGMANGPEEDSGEESVYNALEEIFEENRKTALTA